MHCRNTAIVSAYRRSVVRKRLKLPLLPLVVVPLVLAASCQLGADASRAGRCAKNVVVTGYWPNTNEMLRRWSNDPAQNGGTWVGRNWRNRGFDVYAFFPEFPPDGNPMNDPFGSDGWVGAPDSDLRVDYQDSSADFWRIVDRYRPHVLITTSRGGRIGWELEAVEGGHAGGTGDPADDWSPDGHGAVILPTQDSIDPRSWAAISTYRNGRTLASQLPLPEIAAATEALALESVAIDADGTSGNYLSGFMGLHGLYYNQTAPHNVAAGHIHVGISVSAVNAERLMATTLETVLSQLNAGSLPCADERP